MLLGSFDFYVELTESNWLTVLCVTESHGINAGNYLSGAFKQQVKKIIVDTAKEWPTYFSRLFPVAVSYHGLFV